MAVSLVVLTQFTNVTDRHRTTAEAALMHNITWQYVCDVIHVHAGAVWVYLLHLVWGEHFRGGAKCMNADIAFIIKLTLYGHFRSAEQRTIIQQYGGWYTSC